MLDAAREAVAFTQKKSRKSIETDRELTLALTKCLEIIGEAAARVTEEGQEKLPQIPWADIIGMRNRLVHVYFDIDLDTLRETITQDLPVLIKELEKVVPPDSA